MRWEALKIKRFPLFIDITERRTLVIGGGNIATRRVKALLEFGAMITVISPNITEELKRLKEEGRIKIINEKYTGTLNGDIIIAATNDRAVNREIGETARKNGLIVSVADAGFEGNFWFPAIVNENGLIAGLISEDGSHKKVKEAKERIKEALKQ